MSTNGVDIKVDYAREYATIEEETLFENRYFVEFIWMYDPKIQNDVLKDYLDKWTLLKNRPFVYPRDKFEATVEYVGDELHRAGLVWDF